MLIFAIVRVGSEASLHHVQQKIFTILKIEAVKVCPLYQVAQSLRLKGCEARITYLPEREHQAAILKICKVVRYYKVLQEQVCNE